MSRKPRVYCQSEIYHIIMRGNNQQMLFLSKRDRLFFLQRLKKYSSELNIELYAYCLMNNHVHLLIGKANNSLSLFIQKLANSYVYYFNSKYERSGHLFQGRFKSEPIQTDEYFKTALRYILQNSQLAGLGKFQTYQWNSFRHILNDTNQKIICTEVIFNIFHSKENALNFVSQTTYDTCMEYENKLRINDSKAMQIIHKISKANNSLKLLQLPLEEQKEKVKILKSYGLSCNQILRLTGISKKIIRIS